MTDVTVPPWCCFIDERILYYEDGRQVDGLPAQVRCEQPAAYNIYGASQLLEDNTQACEAHVGALLGTPVGAPMENQSWTVVAL